MAGNDRGSDDRRTARRTGLLPRLRDDLRRGDNVELYVTVALSLCLAILAVFNFIDPTVVSAAILAVLALLAASGLATRHQTAEARASLDRFTAELTGEVPAARFFAQRIPQLHDQVAAATDVRLVGVTLTRTVRDLVPVLERRLRRGASVSVVVIDTQSSAQVEAVARTLGGERPDFYQHRVSSTIDLLGVLALTVSDHSTLQLRVLPFVPTFGMCLIDPTESHGRIHVEIYQHKTVAQNPSFTLRADRDSEWYQLFLHQFEVLWENARPQPLPTN